MAYRQLMRRVACLRPALRSPKPLMSQCQALSPHTDPNVPKYVQPVSVLLRGLHSTSTLSNQYIINIQDRDDFEKQVMSNSTPVIVDFHASWCGPCKLLGPRLESMVASKEGKVILAKIDVDDHGEIAMDHSVQAVPTVLAVKNGKVTDQFVGVKDDSDLDVFINKLIGE